MDISLLLVILLFFLLLKANKTIAVCGGPKRKEFGFEFTNKALVGRLLGSSVAMDEIVCQFSCHANDFCDAYNFNTKTDQCELLDGRASSVKLKTKQDWKFRAQKCEENPCKNSATCIQFNDRPKCLCSCVWKGELCDVPTSNSDNNVMSFPGGSVNDKIVLKIPFPSALSQLSFSTWVQIDPTKGGVHTLLSYATPSVDNTIVLELVSNLTTMMTINDQTKAFTDPNQRITDINWHHVLFTWENFYGKLVLYIDGVKRGEKASVAKNQTIDQNGALVLGQEQDSYLGSFELFQAFKGNLTSLNMWDRVLTASDISDLASKCPTQEGDILTWSTLMNQPRSGNVQLICSPFCMP